MNENTNVKRQLLICLKSFMEKLEEEEALHEDLNWIVESLEEEEVDSGWSSALYDNENFYSDGVYKE
ncbi:MAG TPA: hypothetical protein DCY74_00405 [Clostridiales bacterium]|nr:hypothetical protein [Clostridiales bacterium]HBE12606.1 hypothetical protein [Clostridiales bacterium]HCG35295.1 hypothetical protein [Clostridiales bacterium]